MRVEGPVDGRPVDKPIGYLWGNEKRASENGVAPKIQISHRRIVNDAFQSSLSLAL